MIEYYTEGGGNGGFPESKPKRQGYRETICGGGSVIESQAVLID
jgi:hypothetical protein